MMATAGPIVFFCKATKIEAVNTPGAATGEQQKVYPSTAYKIFYASLFHERQTKKAVKLRPRMMHPPALFGCHFSLSF